MILDLTAYEPRSRIITLAFGRVARAAASQARGVTAATQDMRESSESSAACPSYQAKLPGQFIVPVPGTGMLSQEYQADLYMRSYVVCKSYKLAPIAASRISRKHFMLVSKGIPSTVASTWPLTPSLQPFSTHLWRRAISSSSLGTHLLK